MYLPRNILPQCVYNTYCRNTLLPVYLPTAETSCCQRLYRPQKHLVTSVSTYHRNTLLLLCVPTTGNVLPVCVTTTRTVYYTSAYLPQETSCCRCVLLPQEHFTAPLCTYHWKHLAASGNLHPLVAKSKGSSHCDHKVDHSHNLPVETLN